MKLERILKFGGRISNALENKDPAWTIPLIGIPFVLMLWLLGNYSPFADPKPQPDSSIPASSPTPPAIRSYPENLALVRSLRSGYLVAISMNGKKEEGYVFRTSDRVEVMNRYGQTLGTAYFSNPGKMDELGSRIQLPVVKPEDPLLYALVANRILGGEKPGGQLK